MEYSISEALLKFPGKKLQSTFYQDKHGILITRTAEEWVVFFKSSAIIHTMKFTTNESGIQATNNGNPGAVFFKVTKT